MDLPGWAREPLVHFLVAGALFYAFFAWTSGDAVDPASRVVDVDRDQQAQLALQFERTMGRSPTDAELDAQIEQFIRDEVLYREALRLGLDQGDAVVRRRLVSKMDMAASAAAEVAEPSEDELRSFFEENSARYGGESSLSLDQLYFERESSAQAALSKIQEGDMWRSSGEPISLQASMDGASLRSIRSIFGEEFANALDPLEAGDVWHGPIRSGYGWHLVRVRERGEQGGDFDAMRQRIENDWRSAEIAARKERAFVILRDAYRVEIDR